MKIVHILWSLKFGGIETMLVNIVNEQLRIGGDVSIIIINDMIEPLLMDKLNTKIHVYNLRRKRNLLSPLLSPLYCIKLTCLLKKLSPDAIHLHYSNIYGMILSHELSREASVTLHALPTKSARRVFFGGWRLPGNVKLINKIPYVFSISQAVHDELLAYYGIKSKVICNGIHVSQFDRREMKMYNGKMKIVQVSRLEHNKKGQDLLIQAVARLKGNVTVDFIGEGDSFRYLQSLAKELRADEYIRFLGKRGLEYIAKHLKDYDLFVQPSRYEGFGLTVAEAMAAYVPSLVSAGQGPAEVTCGNLHGWTFENDDVNDLVSKIEYILNHYDEALAKVEHARQHVLRNYDVSVTASEYMKNYIAHRK